MCPRKLFVCVELYIICKYPCTRMVSFPHFNRLLLLLLQVYLQHGGVGCTISSMTSCHLTYSGSTNIFSIMPNLLTIERTIFFTIDMTTPFFRVAQLCNVGDDENCWQTVVCGNIRQQSKYARPANNVVMRIFRTF